MNLNNLAVIVLLFKEKKNYRVLLSYARIILNGMTSNPNYISPNPSLAAFSLHITALRLAIDAWGDKHNRGPHSALVNLRLAVAVVKEDIRGLSHYCMQATPGNASAFLSAGWELKAARSPIGEMPGPSNLRMVILRGKIIQGLIHYRWDKVKGARSYNVWTGNGDVISLPPDPALPFHTVTKAGFDDVAPSGSRRWIVVGCVAANPVTGYSSSEGHIVP